MILLTLASKPASMLKHLVLYFLSIVVILTSCRSDQYSTGTEKDVTYDTVKPLKETVLGNLKRPWSMAFINGVEALVCEKDGDLLKVNVSTKERTVIQDFPADLADSLLVFASNYPAGTYPSRANGFKGRYNAGIFDIVLDPDYDQNKWVYISYVSEKEKKYATKVIRTKIVDERLTDTETLLVVLPYADGLFHFGGGLLFGQDKKLYITAGERLFGDALQPEMPIAQNYSDMRGKIYRINSDGSIPSDNPKFEKGSAPGIYALGIRAAQGLAKDPLTGDIWFSEHGTNQGDELNMLSKAANYGWPVISTGTYRGGYDPPELDRDFTIPKYYWHHTVAPTGLTFYTGTEFPQWKNSLIVPGLSRGNFWRFVIEDQVVVSAEELFIDERDRTRKAVQSPDGQLYILTDEADGRIIRIKNGAP